MSHQQVDVAENEVSPLLPASRSNTTTKREAIGLALITLSCLAEASASVFVKFGGDVFPLSQIVFTRSLIQACLGMIGCIWKGVSPFGTRDVCKMVLLRCLVGATSMILLCYSLLYLPLGDTIVIFSLNTIFAAILAAIILKESFGWVEQLCVVVATVGTVFVAKPSFLFKQGHSFGDNNSDTQATAVLAAVASAFLAAISYIIIRKVGSRVHIFSYTTTYALISMIICGVYMGDFIQPENSKQYLVLGMNGLCAFVGQCLINLGFRMALAGPGALMCTNEVVFAFIYGVLVFREYPDYQSIIGTITIMSTTLGLSWKKWKAE